MHATKKQEGLAVLAMLVVTLVWGGGFVVTKGALDENMGTAAMLLGRFVVGAAAIGLLFGKTIRAQYRPGQWKSGLALGTVLFFGFYAQTFGLNFTTPANSAFLTGAYVVVIPLLWWAISKKRPPAVVFVACLLSFGGIALLSFNPAAGVGLGDALTLLCAVLYAGHIVLTGILARTVHHVVLVFLQFVACAGWSLLAFLVVERDVSAFASLPALGALAYLGLLSTCLCFLLQTLAQKYLSSAKTGIVMGLEGFFGSLFGVVFGYDVLSGRMVAGGALMLAAIVLPDAWQLLRPRLQQAPRGGAAPRGG
ncbi:DMT family transporter [Ruminococcaceae bacterium OttesenSCG-928-O06]|nr:DMT family transporter [Ruminococcaceae bacterium OttesenSCG-928-O06]